MIIVIKVVAPKAPERPRMQTAGLLRPKLQIAVASPDLQARAFPGIGVFSENPVPQEFIYVYMNI